MLHKNWSRDVFCTITNENENIKLPSIRIIFEAHNIPTINYIYAHDFCPYLYENEHAISLNHDDVFYNQRETQFLNDTHGQICDAYNINKQSYYINKPSLPTPYICTSHANASQTTQNVVTQILSIINNHNNNGIINSNFQMKCRMTVVPIDV